MAQCFSLLSFYILYFILSSYKWHVKSCACILSKARNHMIRFLSFFFHIESSNKTFQMLNFKWSSNFILFVGIATGSCQFLLASTFYYIHIFSLNIFLYFLCFHFFFLSRCFISILVTYLTFTLMPFINWKILVRFSFWITRVGGRKWEGWEEKKISGTWKRPILWYGWKREWEKSKTEKPFPLSQFS